MRDVTPIMFHVKHSPGTVLLWLRAIVQGVQQSVVLVGGGGALHLGKGGVGEVLGKAAGLKLVYQRRE